MAVTNDRTVINERAVTNSRAVTNDRTGTTIGLWQTVTPQLLPIDVSLLEKKRRGG